MRIVIPLTAPAIAIAAIFAFILSWNEFLFALILANAKAIKPLSVGFYARVVGGEMEEEWRSILAWATLIIIPILVFFLAIEKKIVEGLTGGAVKG